MICEGKDPKSAVRLEGGKQAILHFDGKNGERIKEFVASKAIV